MKPSAYEGKNLEEGTCADFFTAFDADPTRTPAAAPSGYCPYEACGVADGEKQYAENTQAEPCDDCDHTVVFTGAWGCWYNYDQDEGFTGDPAAMYVCTIDCP